MPIQGDSTTQEPQDEVTYVVLSASAADVTSAAVEIRGLTGQKTVQVDQPGTGTCSVKFQGSYDQIDWFAIGYHEIDSQTAVTRKAGNQALSAAFTGVYLLEDEYDYFRVVQNTTAGVVALTIVFHGFPTN